MKSKLSANRASSKAPLHHPRGYYTHYQPTDNPMMHDWLQLGVRFYNPEIGRFERRDPLPLTPAEEPYSFASAAPSLMVDPTGLKPGAEERCLEEKAQCDKRVGLDQVACATRCGWQYGFIMGIPGVVTAGAAGCLWGGPVGVGVGVGLGITEYRMCMHDCEVEARIPKLSCENAYRFCVCKAAGVKARDCGGIR